MAAAVPLSVCAIEFGLSGGLTAGLLSVALVFATDISQADAGLGAIGYVSHAVAFLLLGGLLGRFVTTRRALEQKIARSEELSLDLMATVGFDGYFKRLNRAWERTLGWSTDELRRNDRRAAPLHTSASSASRTTSCSSPARPPRTSTRR